MVIGMCRWSMPAHMKAAEAAGEKCTDGCTPSVARPCHPSGLLGELLLPWNTKFLNSLQASCLNSEPSEDSTISKIIFECSLHTMHASCGHWGRRGEWDRCGLCLVQPTAWWKGLLAYYLTQGKEAIGRNSCPSCPSPTLTCNSASSRGLPASGRAVFLPSPG